ncbi:rRNA pseudouridine synthase [Streptococcus danieliae]|nr:rRNA pseudouridine synthase [Streptococcus danieliae]
MRLDRYLVEVGLGSRSEVKQVIKKGLIKVNGKVEKSAKAHIREGEDQVRYQDQELTYQTFYYWMLNKPAGVLSATKDNSGKTVLDLLAPEDWRKDVFPVGRLDKDTEGLLLLTNNGPLAHALLSPKRHVSKLYRALVVGEMTVEDQQRFAEGIAFKDFTSQPAELEILESGEGRSEVLIRIQEGKFHQVKRMVAACGKEVTYLERLAMGPLQLDPNLARGAYRPLTEEELALFEDLDLPL